MNTETTTDPADTTPSGILLGRFTPGTAAWDEARAGLTITATEIAAVVGLSPWQSRFSLWHKKSGLPTPPFEMNPAVEWGNRLEDAVATKFADDHPDLIPCPTGTWRHRDRAWQVATPDRLLHPAPLNVLTPTEPTAIFEAKTSPFGDDWGPAGSDEFPVHYRCQILWQQDTTGLTAPAHLAVLIGGWDYREYVVEYDATEATLLRSAAEGFLVEVRDGIRPPIDGADATYQTIRVQPDGLDDVDVEVPLEDAARYEIAQQQMATVKTELTAAKGVLLDHIGTGKRAVVGNRRIAYRTVHDGKTHSLNPYTSKDTAA
ncbi:lambda-exonuclease family protein [Streptomyces sp. NPDC051453]|uniref:YqaJ viral recombinase family nuclease n=1 Tax=Streptomyces sp. NPDC051453 TaxID=3154941 RepID=UPI00341A0A65